MNSIRGVLLVFTLLSLHPLSVFAGSGGPVRKNIVTFVPTGLRIARQGDNVAVETAQARRIKLALRNGFFTGVKYTAVVRRDGKRLPSGSGLQSGDDLREFRDILGGAEFKDADLVNVEYTISIFETNVPPGHLWMPDDTPAYKVLWTQTYRPVPK